MPFRYESGDAIGTPHPALAAGSVQLDGHHDHQQDTARAGHCTPSVDALLPYGNDWPDSDAWLDEDGVIHHGPGPYQDRPLRVVRRKINHLLVVARRVMAPQAEIRRRTGGQS